ncbi:Protein of unknown function DUF604 [Dillenia turbinata]|uniref:Uncharacterized protein n=1 Tax=Dillenia turbinata TaxID=194707 RepID=A0AAN8VJN1_9MAGN
MKVTQKDSEKLLWDQMRNPKVNSNINISAAQNKGFPRLLLWLILFVSLTYVTYTLKLVSSRSCEHEEGPVETTPQKIALADETKSEPQRIALVDEKKSVSESEQKSILPFPSDRNHTAQIKEHEEPPKQKEIPTGIEHIVFGIAAASNLWEQRKNYIKVWYQPEKMRGAVWLDKPVTTRKGENLPVIKISEDTSKFAYSNPHGHRSALRIARVLTETVRLNLPNVRWFVMGDDDTVFFTENLVRVLQKYDHNQYYYIGSLSECHLQNIFFSYSMAYGGGGFAISYPLAIAISKMHDRCIHRYPGLYGSDDRMQACMAELGVPLTKELGFHQYDVWGNLFGLLASHPVAPLVSMHHLDVVEPIFPNASRVEALEKLKVPMKLDSAGLMQQSICYDKHKKWTVSVSWGFAVQVFRGVFSPREIEMPSRTFLNWIKRADFTAYSFNTRPVTRNPCQKPFVFYMSDARFDARMNKTISWYLRHRVPHPACRWKMADPSELDEVVVFKKADPDLWKRSPRRNCCRVLESRRNGRMAVDVGLCREGEVSEV